VSNRKQKLELRTYRKDFYFRCQIGNEHYFRGQIGNSLKIYISSHPWSIIRYFDQIYNLVINSGLGIPKLLPSKFKFSKTWFQKRPCGYLLISFSSLTQWLLQKRGSWLGKYSYGSLPVTEWSSLTVWYKQSVPLLQLRVAWCRISSVNFRNIPNAIL
jgi:hypothetical protein